MLFFDACSLFGQEPAKNVQTFSVAFLQNDGMYLVALIILPASQYLGEGLPLNTWEEVCLSILGRRSASQYAGGGLPLNTREKVEV